MKTKQTGKPILDALLNASESLDADTWQDGRGRKLTAPAQAQPSMTLKVYWPSGHICDDNGRHVATVHLEGWSGRKEIGLALTEGFNQLMQRVQKMERSLDI